MDEQKPGANSLQLSLYFSQIFNILVVQLQQKLIYFILPRALLSVFITQSICFSQDNLQFLWF